jgi:hypothetical protein
VPKVQHKPIKSPRTGSNKKSKRQPKAALVWRTGLSGVPPDSVWCTREILSELLSFGNLGSHSAIIHRTVRCASEKWLTAPTVVCKSLQWTVNSATARAEVRAGARRRTGQWIVTIRWPHKSEPQRSNPNGWVTWLAHRTVSGGAPDCLVRHTTAAPPNDHFGGRCYKYPPTTTLQGIQVFSQHIQYKSYNIQFKTQLEWIKISPSPNSTQSNSD